MSVLVAYDEVCLFSVENWFWLRFWQNSPDSQIGYLDRFFQIGFLNICEKTTKASS
jgi:hypothetical protein